LFSSACGVWQIQVHFTTLDKVLLKGYNARLPGCAFPPRWRRDCAHPAGLCIPSPLAQGLCSPCRAVHSLHVGAGIVLTLPGCAFPPRSPRGFGLRHSLPARRGALATQNRVLAHPFFVSPSSLMQAELATVVGGYKKTG